MPRLQRHTVDCFYYQYSQCPAKRCPFLHRENVKESKYTCADWRLNVCRNKRCSNKHLNKEALKSFFWCAKDKCGQCDNLNCRSYHEKPRIVQESGITQSCGPSPVPRQPKNMWKIKNFLQKDSKQLQNMVRSGSQFLKVVLGYIMKAVQNNMLDREKAKQYTREFLHTILFLGHINLPPIEPQEFLSDFPASLIDKYKDILQMYRTHLPTRPPYSVLLEMTCMGEPAPGLTDAYAFWRRPAKACSMV